MQLVYLNQKKLGNSQLMGPLIRIVKYDVDRSDWVLDTQSISKVHFKK